MKKKVVKPFRKPKRLKMSKRSEKALDRVIIGWKKIKKNKSAWRNYKCLLCELFLNCYQCPVKTKAECGGCYNTPYYRYTAGHYDAPEPKRKRLAQDEINFLESCYY